MKFSCEKALLQSAIAVTSRAVAQKSSIPALEGLLLHADSRLTISGYNLQTGIRTKVSTDVTEPGEIVLNARLFGDIIRRMPTMWWFSPRMTNSWSISPAAMRTLISWASPRRITRSCPWWRMIFPSPSNRSCCVP